jgi:hypothetical protein
MHVFKVTKYDPAHFGERGYFGPLDSRSDHGPLEAAHLAAVEAFALDTGVTELTIREPEISGFVNDDDVAELRTLDRPAVAVELTRAVGAMVTSGYADEENPLLIAVLPDEDGVVRVHWSA